MTTKFKKKGERSRRSGAVMVETSRVTGSEYSLELVEIEDSPPPLAPPGFWLTSWSKRALDLVCASALLVLLLPVLAVVAIAIRLESPGSVFFAHRRLGRDGRHFDCLKFRSMRADAEHLLLSDDRLRHEYVAHHFKIPVDLDPRVTRLGRFLRRSSLDELPQLWNVLKGEMSLVGPRPIVPLEGNYYGDHLPLLLSVRPGITGSWAVHGRSEVGYPDRVDIELEYVRNWRFSSDLEILLRTPVTVFTQRGAV